LSEIFGDDLGAGFNPIGLKGISEAEDSAYKEKQRIQAFPPGAERAQNRKAFWVMAGYYDFFQVKAVFF
jgi:hypothetical protein